MPALASHLVDDGGAKWRQIAIDLRSRIGVGEFAPGDQLPAAAQLAEQYAVGVDAVRDAFDLLRSYNLIVAGRGYRARVRVPPDREVVEVGPGSVIIPRAPSAAEMADKDLALDSGAWVVEVNGVVYQADRVEFRVPEGAAE